VREGKWQESGQTAYCGESKYVPKKEAEVSMPSPDHPLPATVLQVLQFVLALSTIEYNCYGMMTNTMSTALPIIACKEHGSTGFLNSIFSERMNK
jgi:hypothetical protein